MCMERKTRKFNKRRKRTCVVVKWPPPQTDNNNNLQLSNTGLKHVQDDSLPSSRNFSLERWRPCLVCANPSLQCPGSPKQFTMES